MRILIVDDTKAVHAFVKALLAKAPGIAVTDVFDGAQAVELLRGNRAFDLVLLDWEMPKLDGPGTFEELKKMGVTIPVVMMTTKNAPDDLERMLTAGVAEYLMKPFTIDILFEKIAFATGKALPYAA